MKKSNNILLVAQRPLIFICSVIVLLLSGTPMSCSPEAEVSGPSNETTQELGDTLLPFTSPYNTLNNFAFTYNFRQHELSASVAAVYYERCLVDSNEPYQYLYIATHCDTCTATTYGLDEDLTLTENLFENIEATGAGLSLSKFDITAQWTETPADSSFNHVHPDENWYAYSMDIRLELTGLSSSTYLVQGECIFFIRYCSDGTYRIVRWYDYTGESLSTLKAAGGA